MISGASKTTLVKILPKKDQVLQGSHMFWLQADNTFPDLRTQLQTGAGWCLKATGWQIGRRYSLSDTFFLLLEQGMQPRASCQGGALPLSHCPIPENC